MKSVSIREMRASLPRLERMLEQQGEIIVTRRGQAIARLLPMRSHGGLPSHKDLRAKMPRMPIPSEVLIREDRDAR